MLAPRPVHALRHAQACGSRSSVSGHPDAPSGPPGRAVRAAGRRQLPLMRLGEASPARTPPGGTKLAGMSFGISGMVPFLR
jgi:hypothetical protein